MALTTICAVTGATRFPVHSKSPPSVKPATRANAVHGRRTRRGRKCAAAKSTLATPRPTLGCNAPRKNISSAIPLATARTRARFKPSGPRAVANSVESRFPEVDRVATRKDVPANVSGRKDDRFAVDTRAPKQGDDSHHSVEAQAEDKPRKGRPVVSRYRAFLLAPFHLRPPSRGSGIDPTLSGG